jgi:hypothetical protein
MRKMHLEIVAVMAIALLLAAMAEAHPGYTGYSGAPASNGLCASSCHGGSGGTVQISGFPTNYVAGGVYTITVSHSGGSAINQFNGSCRIGTGSHNAGVIAAGTNTATYNVAVETNGIHLTSTDLASGTFLWTAPVSGTGEVRLYIAGHQGSYGGANTQMVLSAQEQTASVGDGTLADAFLTYSYPNPFSAQTVIWYEVPRAAPITLEIFDASGRSLETHALDSSVGLHQFTWNASENPSGAYFYRIQTGGLSQIGRMLLSK